MTEVPSTDYQPIENYGVIGDLHTIALVGMDGSIDFMSFPHFDSPTVFAALLDRQRGGRFQIAPCLEDARHGHNQSLARRVCGNALPPVRFSHGVPGHAYDPCRVWA